MKKALLPFIDPVSKKKLCVKSFLDHPVSRICWYGYLVDSTGRRLYPIVEGVVRIAEEDPFYLSWFPRRQKIQHNRYQSESSVSFFEFEWTLFPHVNNEKELHHRCFDRYKIKKKDIKGKLLLDAGCGAGTESEFFLQQGAKVVSVDLSGAINVAAKRLYQFKNWIGLKADITQLPFPDETFEYVYCEGVIQHTHSSQKTINELVRVTKKGGHLAVWHYSKQKDPGLLSRYFTNLREKRRKKFRKWDRHLFVAYTAFLTALGYIPFVGNLLKRMKIISKKTFNNSFQANWAMTMDALGWHEHQRFVTRDEFKGYFEKTGEFDYVYEDPARAIIHCVKR